ncbi:MAG: carbamoyltransferase HypF [Cellvibrionaceae bacterium]|nr:carbamoyltransferase HypF [Cellvibrionaceae bacterium]
MSQQLPERERLGVALQIRGTVQGVGFRPFIWRLAQQNGLVGWVKNTPTGVHIEAFGLRSQLQQFSQRIGPECPPLAQIETQEQQWLRYQDFDSFSIAHSGAGKVRTQVAVDTKPCDECNAEMRSLNNRRYHYPFTNCTNCGPRLSIVDAIPYDRINTSMAPFTMCDACQAEYKNPASRRFHAQANCCPHCGPKIWLHYKGKRHDRDAILKLCTLLQRGEIIAVKGVGAFHLLCDACNPSAVNKLRQRKQRPHKPFALMAANIDCISQYASLEQAEAELLSSNTSPIVLLDKNSGSKLAAGIAPGLKQVGFMLPQSPLYQLICDEFNGPLVATSGNASGHPPCIDNQQALQQLAPIADGFLLHDRAIVNRLDDSIVRIVAGQTQTLRRARAYVPSAIKLPTLFGNAVPLLAMGAQLKNSFCLLQHGSAIVSQHMGDLDNLANFQDYSDSIKRFSQLYQFKPQTIAVDLHRDYQASKLGRQLAQQQQLKLIACQHHHAHLASCLGENLWQQEPVIGICLDGLGVGDNGQLWGGEIFRCDYRQAERLAGLKPCPLPGGEQAMSQPWRNLVAQLWQCFGADWRRHSQAIMPHLHDLPLNPIEQMLTKNSHCPAASSAGRLFDAVAAALGICERVISYEGQAAMELEAYTELNHCQQHRPYRFAHNKIGNFTEIDPGPIWPDLLADCWAGHSRAVIAARFHRGLAQAFGELAIALARQHGCKAIAIAGGVSQNQLLLNLLTAQCEAAGFALLRPRQLPANDGGLALGQALIAAAQLTPEQAAE